MRKILILVLSSLEHPYDKMLDNSLRTWDSIEVDGVETVFYCEQSDKENTDKIIYMPVDNTLESVTMKTYLALEWALQNKEFDFIARIHSSIYCNKKELVKYIDTLPNENVFSGIVVNSEPIFMWGGFGYVISKDVIEKLVVGKSYWEFDKMDDYALSRAATKLGVPYTNGYGCSIDKIDSGWQCICYGTESYNIKSFSEIKKDNGQYHFRVKQDYDRTVDTYIMEQLYENLK